MEIKYTVFSPSKNITILVETPVEEKLRRFVAEEIMKAEASAEQLGFVTEEKDYAILNMSGGEFCGNAVRCASVLTGKSKVLCSGQLINCNNETAYIPKDIKGIKHYIIERDFSLHKADVKLSESEIRKKAENEDAVGFMYFDEAKCILTPLVYVSGIGSLFWENSCASGSAAVCNYMVEKYNKSIKLDLIQPGGVLSVESAPDTEYVKLSGKIDIIKKDVFCLE